MLAPGLPLCNVEVALASLTKEVALASLYTVQHSTYVRMSVSVAILSLFELESEQNKALLLALL